MDTRINALMSKQLHAHQIQMNARKKCAVLQRVKYSNNHNILPSNTRQGHWPDSLVKMGNLEWKGKTQLNSKMLSADFQTQQLLVCRQESGCGSLGGRGKRGEKRMHMLWCSKVDQGSFFFYISPFIIVVNKSNKMQQLRFYSSQWLTLHVSGDNLTHHQEYISCIWPPVSWLT